MDWQTLTLIAMCLATVITIMTLYHMAHGNERKAVELGAKIVVDSLIKQGRLAPDVSYRPDGAVNLDDDFGEPMNEEPKIDEILMARNRKQAQQMGDAMLDEVMDAMDVEDVVRK